MRSRIRAATGAVYRRARSLPVAGLAFIASLGPAAWFQYGVGITVTGAGVSAWADQSGNGRDLLQATDANRPALQLDGSILFDGVDNFLKCNAFTLNQPETAYILFKAITFTNGDCLLDGNASVTLFVNQRAITPSRYGMSAGTSLGFIAQPEGAYAILSAVANGLSSSIQLNNGAPTEGNAGANNMGGLTVGANGAGNAGFVNAEIKEVVVFPAAHSAAQRSRVVEYLSRVGGL